jgi:hypothetical protein
MPAASTIDIAKEARKGLDLPLTAIIAGYLLYGCAFIYRTSFIQAGVRYFVLMDDEMISMRYAKNLAHGWGMVYNPGGDRVEGFTNLMWMLYMAMLHLLPVSPPKISLLIQLTGLALLAINLFVIARLTESVSGSYRAGLCAAALTAFYFPLNEWGLQGSEVCVLTLMLSASAWLAVRCVESETSAIPLYLLLASATLFRLDAFVPGFVILGMLAVVDRRRRWQHALVGSFVIAIFLAAQLAFNAWYFHDIFPNTYYLKLTGFPLVPRLTRGAVATLKFLIEVNPLLPALVVALILFRRDWRLVLIGLIFGVTLLYNIWIGGDFTDVYGGANRFISVAMPLFFVLLACVLDSFASFLARAFPDFFFIAKPGAAGFLAVLTLFTLLTVNLPVPPEAGGFQFDQVSSLRFPLTALLLLDPPTGVTLDHLALASALTVRQVTDADARIMVPGAGIIPYFSDRFSIEILGKTDATIARETWRPLASGARWHSFLPGHFKWDYHHSIVEMKPDLILGLLPWDENTAQLWLDDYSTVNYGGAHWYVRKDSTHVHIPTYNNRAR